MTPNLQALLMAGCMLGCLSCTGEIGDADSPPVPDIKAPGELDCNSDLQQLSLQLPQLYRSLTGQEYSNVLASVFPNATEDVRAMPNPFLTSEVSSTYTTDGNSLKMNQPAVVTLLEHTNAIARTAALALKDEHSCLNEFDTLPDGQQTLCLEDLVDGLLAKLYNEEVVPSERTLKLDYLQELLEDLDFDLALETFTASVMMSPRVLFRSELGEDVGNGTSNLTARELANALSFTIASNRPDAALLADIEDGTLSEEEVRTHAQRLAEQASKSGPEHFVGELLSVRNLNDVVRFDGEDEDAIPREVRNALLSETQESIKRVVRSEGALTENLFMSQTTLARENTLELHGVTADSSRVRAIEDGFFEIDTPDRPGIMLQPAMMAMLSAADHTDPVKRGNFVLDKFVCFVLPLPPADVPALAQSPDEPLTVRQRLETLHQDPSCQVCHRFMDGIGFSFEAFDHLGRERTTELGMPVDTSGEVLVSIPTLDGELTNAQELMSRLGSSPEVQACISTHAFGYISGVYSESKYDSCLYRENAQRAETAGGDIVDTFALILSSDQYRVRYETDSSAPTPEPEPEPQPQPEPEPAALESCLAYRDAGRDTDGMYVIARANGEERSVYCDMSTDQGGWTLVMSTNGKGPSELSELGLLDVSDEGYLEGEFVEELAQNSEQVAIRQMDSTDALTSVRNSLPIQNLRELKLLNDGSSLSSSTAALSDWTGTRAQTPGLFFTCSIADNGGYPNIYWACGNVNGLHLTGGVSSWSSSGENAAMQLWVR